jgi:hypothetical protein
MHVTIQKILRKRKPVGAFAAGKKDAVEKYFVLATKKGRKIFCFKKTL